MVRENKTECKMTFRNEEPHVNKCFPRVRGDVPVQLREAREIMLFSPRARGCSFATMYDGSVWLVFPACAGMFRTQKRRHDLVLCFPRVRGDVPADSLDNRGDDRFSPRARGCSCTNFELGAGFPVFPACAGMFRKQPRDFPSHSSFPRVRGDVPLLS